MYKLTYHDRMRPIHQRVSEGVDTVDRVLFRYFYRNRIVETEELQDAWMIFDEYYRGRTHRRVFGTVVATLENLEQVMSAIRDILEVWEFGPHDDQMLVLDKALEKFLAVRRYRRGSIRTAHQDFRVTFGLG